MPSSIRAAPFNLTSPQSFLACVILGWLTAVSSPAAEVRLGIEVTAAARQITVRVDNQSLEPVRLAGATIELNGHVYPQGAEVAIHPGQSFSLTFPVIPPERPGSYALITRVRYHREGEVFSLSYVSPFHRGPPRGMDRPARLSSLRLRQSGILEFTELNPGFWRIVLPEEIEVVADRTQDRERRLTLRGRNTRFINTYPIFAYAEKNIDGISHLQVVQAELQMNFADPAQDRGLLPVGWLVGIIGTFAGMFVALSVCRPEAGPAANAFIKYTARMILVFSGYLFVKQLPEICGVLAALPAVGSLFAEARGFFLGADFDRFFLPRANLPLGIADIYWVFMATVCWPFSFWADQDTPWHEDKYGALLWTIFGFAPRIVKRWHRGFKPPVTTPPPLAAGTLMSPARLGALTFAIKVFYIPLLTAWVTQNINHMAHLTQNLQFTLPSLNHYLRESFILIDTAVFCFGYLFEATFLKNRIKSVEPTLLGWIVCLWCYPPFNHFSFRPFVETSLNVSLQVPGLNAGWIAHGGQILVTVGWGIFAWASLSLGFKASNLTNRGIVTRGPYRYCRHPAYAVKMATWLVGSIWFAQHGATHLLALAAIYYLRAWTEERHLSRDPAYLAYKEIVKHRFIPGVV